MPNPFENRNIGLDDPAVDFDDAVTPDNDNDLPLGTCRALRCLVAGVVVGITAAGNERVTELFNPGEILPYGFSRIKENDVAEENTTTATVEAMY